MQMAQDQMLVEVWQRQIKIQLCLILMKKENHFLPLNYLIFKQFFLKYKIKLNWFFFFDIDHYYKSNQVMICLQLLGLVGASIP